MADLSTADYVPGGVDPAVARFEQFIALAEFLTRWGGQKERLTEADYPALNRGLRTLTVAPCADARWTDDIPDRSSASTDVAVIVTAFPNWFRDKLVYLLLGHHLECYGERLQSYRDQQPYLVRVLETYDLAKLKNDPRRAVPFLNPKRDGVEELGLLGSYSVRRVIGEGGMGIVFAAVKTDGLVDHPDLVALKTLIPEIGSRTADKRFKAEAESLHKVRDHSNVVEIIDHRIEMENSPAYIVMEYVPGPTLHELIQHHATHPVPIPVALDLIRQIAAGLKYIHEKGLTHRDLKPGNVLLQQANHGTGVHCVGRPRVADFGLTVPAEGTGLTEPGMKPGPGTPGYRSPEQVAGQKVNGRSDIFALGIISYELLTGRPQPRSPNGVRVPGFHESFPQPTPPQELNPQVPAVLGNVVLKMLAEMPAERYDTSELIEKLKECEAALEASCDGQKGVVRADTRTIRWLSLPNVRRLSGYMTLTVVVTGLAWVAFQKYASPGQGEGAKHSPPTSASWGTKDGPVGVQIGGQVRDMKSFEPIVDAEVTLVGVSTPDNRTVATRTDRFGMYRFQDLPSDLAGQIRVLVVKPGYEPSGETTQSPGTTGHTILLSLNR